MPAAKESKPDDDATPFSVAQLRIVYRHGKRHQNKMIMRLAANCARLESENQGLKADLERFVCERDASLEVAELLDRMPPNDPAAELAVLGAVLLKPDTLNTLKDVLIPEDFYDDSYRRVWKCLESMSGRGLPIDSLTLSAQLKQAGDWEGTNFNWLVAEILNGCPCASNARHYAEILAGHAERRRTLQAAIETIKGVWA